MPSQKSGDFEFKLGKFGLIVFTFGISLFLLFSFIFGVIVGKHIESYPEKIAIGIPSAIKEKITKKDDEKTELKAGEKEEFELTFYDTLPKKREEEVKVTSEKKSGPEVVSKASEEKPGLPERYLIQVASFKDEERMKKLRKRLSAMGYTPSINEISLASSGHWFRVKLEGFATFDEAAKTATFIEKKISGLKCLVTKCKE
ncbi:MAG: SPOR domain-containing protein [Thermodesulfobacteriota bacterium]|nr:SPOR domain-containing protein [Thermodesulfobacteriota bacterium]